jgi:hypothetical protein
MLTTICTKDVIAVIVLEFHLRIGIHNYNEGAMDVTNHVIRLCLEGTRAEFEKRPDDARALYQQAWDARQDDYEACIAAHYVARFQDSSEHSLYWNQRALQHANAVGDERVRGFYPSLYLNLGRSYETVNDRGESQRYYELAAELGVIHQPD